MIATFSNTTHVVVPLDAQRSRAERLVMASPHCFFRILLFPKRDIGKPIS
jgi:hypothetical protein